MKTLLSVAVASIALGVMGAQQVGVTAITTTNKNTIVSVPFTALGGGATITAKELVKTQGLTAGTALYIFSGGTYTAWVLSSGNEWVATSTTYLNDQGESVTVPAAGAGQTLNPGDAIWLIRADTDATKTFYVYGTPWTPTAKTIVAGYNLVANPKQTAATPTVTNPVKGDQILVPNDGTPDVYIYRVNSKNVGAWRKNNTSVDLPTIGTGLGFWYISKGTGATTITWAE